VFLLVTFRADRAWPSQVRRGRVAARPVVLSAGVREPAPV